jgi:hypothetical protein
MEDLGGGHLTALARAAYLDRGLSPDETGRVEAHLADCERCRRELTQEWQLVRRVRHRRRSLAAIALVASAAALVLVVSRIPRTNDAARFRGNGPQESASAPLVAYGPIGEQRTSVRRFVWGPASGALSYRLTITRGDGTVFWSTSVADTSAILPDTLSLAHTPRYFWVVDAILRDGRTRSTGLHEIIASP